MALDSRSASIKLVDLDLHLASFVVGRVSEDVQLACLANHTGAKDGLTQQPTAGGAQARR